MSNLDPKELKVLTDILALVLEDQSGQSANALDALRKRARRDKVTGGALKSLFRSLASDPSYTGPRSAASNARLNTEILEGRRKLNELNRKLQQLNDNLRQARSQNESLRSELYRTQNAYTQAHMHLSQVKDRNTVTTMTSLFTFGCGVILGITCMVVFHTLKTPALPPVQTVPNTFYVH